MSKEKLLELNEKLKKLKRKKRKIVFKKGLYISSAVGVSLAVAIAPSIALDAIHSALGHSPFENDDVAKELHTKTVISSIDDEKVSNQYGEFDDEKNKLVYYSGWDKTDDDCYSLTKTTYDIDGLSSEEVKASIADGNIQEIGKAIQEETITQKEITGEKDPYYEAVIYEINKDDVIYIPQTAKEEEDDVKLFFITDSFATLGTLALFAGTTNFYEIISDKKNACTNSEWTVDVNLRKTEEEIKKKKMVLQKN